ncbi:MAG: SDR family oxidoreductase [Eubacteriales bacterium]|nr:SDR family oxidoreductase [Eubacteriales bacterium]
MKHTKDLFSLKGKVAIVTGGRGKYGASISEGLCEMDATVVIASRNGEKCEEFAKTLREKGYDAIGMSLDLGSDESIEKLVKDVIDRYGKIDILVNNAVDRSNMCGLKDATREKLQGSANTNLNGQIILSQKVLEYMIPVESGSIINISSMRGLDCPHFPLYPETWGEQAVNYTTEKWALVGLTKFMAGRYGKHHIRVNCIAPGGFDPDLATNPDKQDFIQSYIDNCPLGCWANEDDIKGPVVFLASEASNYVTGATLVMDGGWTIW